MGPLARTLDGQGCSALHPENKQEESPRLKLLLDRQREELLANGQANLVHRNSGFPEQDLKPVVKPFRPCGGATWASDRTRP